MRKLIAIKIMKVTGYTFPKYGIFGRGTKSREVLEKIIGTKAVTLNWDSGLM